MEQIIKSKIYGTIPDMLRGSTDTRCDTWWSRPMNMNEWSFCALGTISHQMGQHPFMTMFGGKGRDKIIEHCNIKPEDAKKSVQCTICNARRSLIGLVAHHNDTHHLAYKENADALEKSSFYKETTTQQKYLDTIARNDDGSYDKVLSKIIRAVIKN